MSDEIIRRGLIETKARNDVDANRKLADHAFNWHATALPHYVAAFKAHALANDRAELLKGAEL
jgi:hypothetical protein